MIAAAVMVMHVGRAVVRAQRTAARLVCTSALATVVACQPPAAPSTVAAPTRVDARRAEAFLDTLQQRTFQWFWDTTDPRTGLTPDRWPARTFSSVAAIGFALTAYPIGAERGYVTRAAAAERTLSTLRFLWQLPQGETATGVAGYKGFFYHFLDYDRGLRFEKVELSTIDTSLLLAGALFCQSYFTGAAPVEASVRAYADSLYRRVEWTWPRNRAPAINMGWKPEDGMLPFDWRGYDEAMIVYLLALGSPTHAVEPSAWEEWTKTYHWRDFYGQEHVNFAPLFGHQYSHVWVDFRGIRDAYMRGKGIDYFENSRRATLSQRAYAIDNPYRWVGYGPNQWGLTASDGPRDGPMTVEGIPRVFFTYAARGAAWGEIRDDGTIAPTAVGGSVPFAPEITIPALRRPPVHEIRISGCVQRDVPANRSHGAGGNRGSGSCLVRQRLPRYRSGPDHRDDREPPHGTGLAGDADQPIHQDGTRAGGLHWRMA
jgi:hypothetical protein